MVTCVMTRYSARIGSRDKKGYHCRGYSDLRHKSWHGPSHKKIGRQILTTINSGCDDLREDGSREDSSTERVGFDY